MLWSKEFYFRDSLWKENYFLPISSMTYKDIKRKKKFLDRVWNFEGRSLHFLYSIFLSIIFVFYFLLLAILQKLLAYKEATQRETNYMRISEEQIPSPSFFIVLLALVEKYCTWEDQSLLLFISKMPIVLKFYHSRAWSLSHPFRDFQWDIKI